MPAVPIAVRTTRYRCPFCTRSRSRRATTAAHIARCWRNPEVRACLTCVHRDAGGDACGCEPGCNWGASGPVRPLCGAGLLLGEDHRPVSNCPQWQARGEEPLAASPAGPDAATDLHVSPAAHPTEGA